MFAKKGLSLALFFYASMVVIQCSAQTDSMTYQSCSAIAKSMTLEQAVESLTISKDANAFWGVVARAGVTGAPGPPTINIIVTINDPRVDRIRILLKEMKPVEASGLIKKKYLAELDRFKTDWETELKRNGILLGERRHSVSSLLFLCSEFCPAKEFDALFLKWHIWHRQTEYGENIDFGVTAKADELFVTNTYVNALRRRGDDLASVAKSVSRACELANIRRFSEVIDISKNRILVEQTDADYFVIRGWGDNEDLGFKSGSNNSGTLNLIQQLRGELIPEVKLYNTTIASIQKWLDDNGLTLDPASK